MLHAMRGAPARKAPSAPCRGRQSARSVCASSYAAGAGSFEAGQSSLAAASPPAESHAADRPWQKPGYQGAWVSQQSKPVQAGILAGLTVIGAALTYYAHTVWGPWLCANVSFLADYMSVAPYIFAAMYMVSGSMHFLGREGYSKVFPHQGAWGVWYLPGSPAFHVMWTGLAAILGGIGVLLGGWLPSMVPAWLLPASAAALFVLTIFLTPANIYMITHNATPFDNKEPFGLLSVQAPRMLLQVVFMATFFGLARTTWIW